MVLIVVGYDKGHLSLRGTNVSIESTHGNQFAVYFDHESQSVQIVDGGESLNLTDREGRMESKEPQVARTGREVLMEIDQELCIIWSDRPQVATGSVR